MSMPDLLNVKKLEVSALVSLGAAVSGLLLFFTFLLFQLFSVGHPTDIAPEGSSGKFEFTLILFGFVCQVVALLSGILALNRIKYSQGQLGGRGLAIAGTVIAITSVLLAPLVFLFFDAALSPVPGPDVYRL